MWMKTPKGAVVHVTRGARCLRLADRVVLGRAMDLLIERYKEAGMEEENEASMAQVAGEAQPTKTVWCNSNRQLTRSFVLPAEAVKYANQLLRAGHKVRLADWKPPKSGVDRQLDRIMKEYPAPKGPPPPWLRKG